MLLFALQYWNGDRKNAMRLARRIAALEKTPRKDVEFLFVVRFDAEEPDPQTVSMVSEKMKVSVYRTKRRGEGHPGGCNDMWHDLVGEMWRRTLQEKGFHGKYTGIFSFEADVVPLCADWIARVLEEWKQAQEKKCSVWGCYMPTPAPHINGNMIWIPNIFGVVGGLEGCPSQYAWDVFHAHKWIDTAFSSDQIINYYRAVEVPKNRLYDSTGKAKFALVHGVKDDSAWTLAEKFVKI
ncbi:MAG: hypothetical protein EBR82_21570 [Caulobacteraceae bacterium]|nr:hypothetical protein [Caulobacteraceae bacterium]